MPQGPAARVGDPVSHPLPPVLMPGPGSPTVRIANRPAWRGMPRASVAALQLAKAASDKGIAAAEASTQAAAGSPGAPAALAVEQALKSSALVAMSAAITAAAGGADLHQCTTPSPSPVHGPGVVVDGSATVLINNLPACRMGDQLLEAIGPANKIARGESTVTIGG